MNADGISCRTGAKIRRDRCGVHLFDRWSGLNVLVDEIDVARDEWARAPRHLAIALTNACDLRCPYCYAPKHRACLDANTVMGWLHEIDDAGCLGVGFGGGEPTVAPGFVELCRRAAAETSLAVSFTTHGHRLTAETVEQLRGSVHFVRVSVDGTGDVYEQLRGRAYDRLVEQLALVATLASFGINVVVNVETVVCLDEIAALAADTGATEILLLPEQPTPGRPPASPATIDRFRCWVTTYAGPPRLAVSEQGAGNFPVAEPFGDQPSIERYAHVDASGWIRPSSYSTTGVKIGDGSLLDAYEQLQTET